MSIDILYMSSSKGFDLGQIYSTQTLYGIAGFGLIVGGTYGLYKLYRYQKGDSYKKDSSETNYSTSLDSLSNLFTACFITFSICLNI